MTTTTFRNRISTKKRRETRLEQLLGGCKALGVPLGTEVVEGRMVFTDNVINRDDDADPRTLDRYVLIYYDDEHDNDVWLHSFATRRGLKGELALVTELQFLVAFDLDGCRVLHPEWHTTIKLNHGPRADR